MNARAQVRTQAIPTATPGAAHIARPPMGVPDLEHEAERPDIAGQPAGAARLGHSLGAVGVASSAPPLIQRQEIPEEEEEELQLKRGPAAIQRQELPEEEEELMLKPEEGRVGPQGGPVPPEVEAAIGRARGGGQPLERALQELMGASLGHDFSGVRVHTDEEADDLNQQLSAKAFTTGADIFFKHGAYEPGSSSGRELIAHELGHVAQQSSGRVNGHGSGMTVRPADDAFEQEANAMAPQKGNTYTTEREGQQGDMEGDVRKNGKMKSGTTGPLRTSNVNQIQRHLYNEIVDGWKIGDLIYGLAQERADTVEAIEDRIRANKLLASPLIIDNINKVMLFTETTRQATMERLAGRAPATKELQAGLNAVVEDLSRDLGIGGAGVARDVLMDRTRAQVIRFKKHLKEAERRGQVPPVKSLRDLYGRIKANCQQAITWTVDRGGHIHFILDGINLRKAALGLRHGEQGGRARRYREKGVYVGDITSAELRYTYRNWEKLRTGVTFYRDPPGRDVFPPWVWGNRADWAATGAERWRRRRAVSEEGGQGEGGA